MTNPIVRRRFLQVGARRVHYLRSGDGPPVVLVHSSPANTRLLAKEIEHLSRDFTVFAFDTPGFGLSEPLPLATMTVADLADALADTIQAVGLPRCPVFGTHTGASIALELGVRHPAMVTGLILDGLAAFTPAECAAWFGEYFRKLPISDLGGHYADTWTRFRDQSIWFPWTARDPAAINEYDLSLPHSTHLWMQMYFDAADSYEPAYRAALFHGQRAVVDGIRALVVPAVICATETDMLYPHLERLPELRPNQRIADIGSSYDRKRTLIGKSFADFGSDGPAPKDTSNVRSSLATERQFIDGSVGQLHFRYAGQRSSPTLLLLHDAPGSSEQATALIAALAERYFVIAPDLPGNGESDPFIRAPSIEDYAREALTLLDTLEVDIVHLYGIGFGSSVALAIAELAPQRIAELTLQGLALLGETERALWIDHMAPPIDIKRDGSHWYRTWLMLRDSQIYFPWFDTRRASLRRLPADFGERRLHKWTVDVMRARATYGALINAALSWDARGALARSSIVPRIVHDEATPLCAYNNRISVALSQD